MDFISTNPNRDTKDIRKGHMITIVERLLHLHNFNLYSHKLFLELYFYFYFGLRILKYKHILDWIIQNIIFIFQI